MAKSTLSFKRDVELSGGIGELWPFFSNTDRLNRAMGLPAVTYDPPREGELTRLARTKVAGAVSLKWIEPPFEWLEGQFYAVRRKFMKGPVEELLAGARFFPNNGATHVEIFTDITPRNGLGAFLARAIIGKKSMNDFEKVARQLETPGGSAPVFALRRAKSWSVDLVRLGSIMDSLKPVSDPSLPQRLLRHLVNAPDPDVVRMRPFALADQWKTDRIETLTWFLRATKGGILDAKWDILCPNCRVTKAEFSALNDFKNKAHCELCQIDFSGQFDQNVEIRFTVNASIRKADDAVYCVGGPANTPHRLMQLLVAPGETRTVKMELSSVGFLARSLQGKKKLFLRPDRSAKSASVTLSFDEGEPVRGEISFLPGPVEIKLENKNGAQPVWIVLDQVAWSHQAATAALVTSLQEFRDLFSSELLSPDEQVAVQNVALMFSDLKDSTAMYERIGDATAYGLVRDHFRILLEAVREHNGCVIKTIGDAVMAAFSNTEDAVEAACVIQRRFQEFNSRRGKGTEKAIVKLGVHAGPAIVITSENHLDYFGTTVNAAARIQSESVGNDMVISEGALEAGREALNRHGCRLEDFQMTLKGISKPFHLWRAWIPSASS